MPLFRPLWFRLAPTDLDFMARAPHRLEVETLIYTTPERVFEILSKPEGMDEWLLGFTGFRWKSPSPQGVGSMRELHLRGAGFREHFLIWDPGTRLCFAIAEVTAPLMKRMMEDICLESAGMSTTRLHWRIYYEPTLLLRAIHPIARFLIREGYKLTVDRLSRYVLRQSTTTA